MIGYRTSQLKLLCKSQQIRKPSTACDLVKRGRMRKEGKKNRLRLSKADHESNYFCVGAALFKCGNNITVFDTINWLKALHKAARGKESLLDVLQSSHSSLYSVTGGTR